MCVGASALKCSSPLGLQRVAGLCLRPCALEQLSGESSPARTSRAQGAPRAGLAELRKLALGAGGVTHSLRASRNRWLAGTQSWGMPSQPGRDTQ